MQVGDKVLWRTINGNQLVPVTVHRITPWRVVVEVREKGDTRLVAVHRHRLAETVDRLHKERTPQPIAPHRLPETNR